MGWDTAFHSRFTLTSKIPLQPVIPDYACSFFFQAEDGIRVAQESRVLGDVYKRQDYKGISV